jgi:hypothetical protein
MGEFASNSNDPKLIEYIDPQKEVQKNAEAAKDWEYTEEAAYLYRMANLFKNRLLDPILLTQRRRLPDPVISFENQRNQKVLAAYTLARNPQGLLYEITMNTQQYMDEEKDGKITKTWLYGKWAQMETLLHEQVHLWQQNFGKDPVQPGKVYHNKEFVEKCESLGLHPMPGVGCHISLADGVFENLMNELGIKPNDLRKDWFKWFLDTSGERRKGQSSLKKWVCPECGLNVRIGIKSDPQIRHEPCERKTGHDVFFVKSEDLTPKEK